MHSCHKNSEYAHSSHSECVSLVPIFNHLEPEQLDEVMKTTQSVSYEKNEVIYHAGDKSDSLYIINKGSVRIYRLSESGKEQLVRILNVGDFIGELALFSETIHESYAEALVQTDICFIKRTDLQSLLLKYPSIALKVLSEFSHRLEESEKQTTRFSTENVETRLALFLAEQVAEEESGNRIFTLPMSKKNIASYLGSTPETISRKFNELEERGYIEQLTYKKIKILDLEALQSV